MFPTYGSLNFQKQQFCFLWVITFWALDGRLTTDASTRHYLIPARLQRSSPSMNSVSCWKLGMSWVRGGGFGIAVIVVSCSSVDVCSVLSITLRSLQLAKRIGWKTLMRSRTHQAEVNIQTVLSIQAELRSVFNRQQPPTWTRISSRHRQLASMVNYPSETFRTSVWSADAWFSDMFLICLFTIQNTGINTCCKWALFKWFMFCRAEIYSGCI